MLELKVTELQSGPNVNTPTTTSNYYLPIWQFKRT